MKRIIIVAGLVLGSLAAGIAALPWLLTPKFIASEIESVVERASGRGINFAGEPRLSLWPEAYIEIPGPELANPKGMATARFASAEALRLKVSAWPLFRGRVEIDEVLLVRPRINLVIEADGRSNFALDLAMGEGQQRTDAAIAGLPQAPLVLEDAEIRFLDERSGAAFAVSHVDLAVELPAHGEPLEIKGEFAWNRQGLDFAAYVRSPARLSSEGSPVDINITSPLLTASFSGLAALKNGIELAGKAEATTRSLRDFSALAGMPLPQRGLEELSVAGSLDLSGSKVKFKEARLKLDQTNGQGSFTLDLAGPRPRISATLGVDRIDFNRYFAAPAPGAESNSGFSSDWSAAPVHFAALKRFDAELVLAATEILAGKVVIGRSRLDATLAEGILVAGLTEAAFYGGTAEGRLVLDGSGSVPSVRSSLTANGIDGERFLADAAGLGQIAGKANLDINVEASGTSQQELISMLKGVARFRVAEGTVATLDVAKMVESLQQEVLEGWSAAAERQTRFSLLEANFEVADGIAETRDLKLIGTEARVTAEGSIDLLRRRVDFKARPFVAASSDGSRRLLTLPVPVVIEGSWSAPKIYPDVMGMLENPQAGYAALKKLMGKGKAIGLDESAGKIDKAATEKAEVLGKPAGEPKTSQ